MPKTIVAEFNLVNGLVRHKASGREGAVIESDVIPGHGYTYFVVEITIQCAGSACPELIKIHVDADEFDEWEPLDK